MKTLYVTDLDGTLLNTRSFINPESLEIINGLVRQGMIFTYATARSVSSASKVTRGLHLQHPLITYNGAFLIAPESREIMVKETFSEEEICFVQGVLEDTGISPLVYGFVEGAERVTWVTSRENIGIRHYIDGRPEDPRLRPLSSPEGLYDGEIFYFTCIAEQKELEPLREFFMADERFTCTFQQELYREEYWFEIMPKKATKAQGILRLKKLLGCDRVVSFGDGINDLPMFSISDECYAVENAVQELKAAATRIIGSNDENGVALWLKENFAANKE